MYVALIWSRIDYSCVDLVVIQAQALRFCLKAVEKASVCTLQVEEGEMPL